MSAHSVTWLGRWSGWTLVLQSTSLAELDRLSQASKELLLPSAFHILKSVFASLLCAWGVEEVEGDTV